ncbi:MAG: LysM peptidoglycan-binding domain-containing protein [Chloroflexota bacterium]
MLHTRIVPMVWLSLCLLALVVGAPVRVSAQQPGNNLLVNGDFEAGYGQSWPFQDGIAEVQVAPGWRAFYVDIAPPGTVAPNYCNGDAQCAWGRPEFRGTSTAEFIYRVRSGNLSQKYFSWNRQHEAGLMQQVSGIQPGTRLRFEVYMQTWSCMPGEQWNECPTTPYSYLASPMHTQVGIDPSGGMNPWAASVVWAAEQSAYDAWVLFAVEATAQSDKVTVFTYSRADWSDGIPRIANDVYIDDASLVAVSSPPPPTPTSPPAQPEAVVAVPVTVAAPRPDGSVVHVVQAGQTLAAIAEAYGVPADEIARLNGLADAGLIAVGQELIIVAPAPTPTAPPTPTPEPPTPTPTPEPPTPTATDTPLPPPPTATPQAVAETNDSGFGFHQSQQVASVTGITPLPVATTVATVPTLAAETPVQEMTVASDEPAVARSDAAPSQDTVYTLLFVVILVPLAVGWVVVQVRQRRPRPD